jgi:hypothetical protein
MEKLLGGAIFRGIDVQKRIKRVTVLRVIGRLIHFGGLLATLVNVILSDGSNKVHALTTIANRHQDKLFGKNRNHYTRV